jgi:hypothetical protein
MNTKLLLTVYDLSERTGLPLAWLRREADAGRLPCLRVGRRRMFDLAAVMNELAKRQTGGTQPEQRKPATDQHG